MVWRSLILGVLALSPSASAQATGPSSPVFQCAFGAKRVTVVSAGPVLRYAFGPPGNPEIRVIGDPARGTVRYHRTLFAHAEHKQLRFVNGAYSYVLFNRWSSPDYRGRGAEDRSGLIVQRDGRTLARRDCSSGGAFSTTYDFSTLPDDGADAVPD